VARRTYPALEKVEIINPTTIRFVNRTPDLTLEGRISRNTGMIISRDAFEKQPNWLEWSRRPIGTGPYRITDFRADQVLTMEAFDEYWGGRPPARRLRFVEVPEVASRLNMLLSGEADFACDIPPDQIRAVERSGRHEIVGGTIMNHRLTVFEKNDPHLRNPLIRRAFPHGSARETIVAALFGGRSVVPKGLQFDFYGSMLLGDWAPPRYDLTEARRLLREAGYRGEPIPYRLLAGYYTNQLAVAQVLVEGWRSVGLNVQIEMRENFPQVLSREGQRGVRDWSNSASYNDPVSSLTAQHGPEGQQWQIGEWTNEEFGRLSEQLDTGTDPAQRRATFRRMLEIAEREDPAYTVLHQSVNLTAKRRDIRWNAGQSFVMDFRARNWGV
jgi:peptide/nickel transport system substrate-binding protein